MKAISYSEYNSYVNYRDDWFKRYILGERDEPNKAMKFGTLVHEMLENPKRQWIPESKPEFSKAQLMTALTLRDKALPKRLKEQEKVLTAEKDGVRLIAIYDTFDPDERIVGDYKTTSNMYRWNQWVVDNDEQLSFYAWVYYLVFRKYLKELQLHRLFVPKEKQLCCEKCINPEISATFPCRLDGDCPCHKEEKQKATVKTFYTARGPKDIADIEYKVMKVVDEMKSHGYWEKRKSSKELKEKTEPLALYT